MSKRVFLAILVVGLIAPGAMAAKNKDIKVSMPNGYIAGEHFAALSKKAVKAKAMIAIVQVPEKTKEFPKVMTLLGNRNLRSMARVMVYSNKVPTAVKSVFTKSKAPKMATPSVVVIDYKGNAIAYASGNMSAKEVNYRLGAAAYLSSWVKKANSKIASAESSLKLGRFNTAMKTIEGVAKEDSKNRKVIEKITKTQSLLDQPREPRPAKGSSKLPQIIGDGFYFPDLIDTYEDKIEKAADEQLAQVKKIAAESSPAKAMALGRKLLQYTVGMDIHLDVQETVDELKAQIAEAKAEEQIKAREKKLARDAEKDK